VTETPAPQCHESPAQPILGGSSGKSVSITIPGKPRPASRPRVVKGHAYIAPTYAQWLDAAKWEIVRQVGRPLWTGEVSAAIQFRGARANADIDNLIKGVLDAATGSVFVDDKQVTSILAQKILAGSATRVIFRLRGA